MRINEIGMSMATSCLGLVALAACASCDAAVITDWSFEGFTSSVSSDNTPTATTDTTGTASASIIGMLGGPEGDITSESGAPGGGYVWRIRGTSTNGWTTAAAPDTQGVQFNVSTAGETGISLSFLMAASSNGIDDLDVQYTLNGSTWITAEEVALTTAYSTPVAVSLAGIAGVANDANFGVRLVSQYAPGTSAYAAPPGGSLSNGSGNWRMSDFQVDGTPVPLPASAWLMLCGVGGLGVMARRRRTRAA